MILVPLSFKLCVSPFGHPAPTIPVHSFFRALHLEQMGVIYIVLACWLGPPQIHTWPATISL